MASGSKLEPRLTELVRLRVSQVNGCAFCIDMHTKDARAAFERALALARQEPERRFLERRLAELGAI